MNNNINNSKNIIIQGKQSNDVFNIKKEERIRIGASDEEISIRETTDLLSTEDVICKKAITIKINGYKYQDQKKNFKSQLPLISLQEVKQKLLDCDLKCFYCNKNVKVIYRLVRDPLQWTLDRIDNKKNHSNSNTLISCLHCNLKRRNINKDKFSFSQNLTIVKVD